jgi:signal transduction histidine kinase
MKRWPLRLKLCLWAVIFGGVTLMAIGAIIAWRVKQTAEAPVDANLQSEMAKVLGAIHERTGPIEWTNPEAVAPVLETVPKNRLLQIETPPGNVVYQSGKSELLPPATKDHFLTAHFGSRTVRVIQEVHNNVLVRLGADSEPVDRVLHTIWTTCAWALPVVLLSMWVGAWWLSKRVLRPVEELVEAAAEIDARTSDRQLPAPGTNDEVGHLTDVLNNMFSRIRQSFVQARRFSADASHELKTPLTIIRGEVEAALRSDQLPPQTEKTMLDLLEETGRLINIVEGLLLLSQADAGKLQFDLKPVSLTTLLADIVEDIEILASPRDIAVHTDFEQNVFVEGNAQFLRQVALNLFDNAIKYNLDRGEIRAMLSVANGLAVFVISNTGTGIPEEDRPRIFDRFHRADRSRDRLTGGQGLGLSICREIIRAHGGDITLEPAPSGWTKFQLTLPSRDLTKSGVRRADQNAEVKPLGAPQSVVTRVVQ